MKTVILMLVLGLPQGTSTQIYHVRGDRDHYTGVVGDKQVEITTKIACTKQTMNRLVITTWGKLATRASCSQILIRAR